MPPEKANEYKSLLYFHWVGFRFDNASNTYVLPRGVVKLPSENPMKKLFFFTIRKQMLIFFSLGMESCFFFPFSMTEPPSDLNLCMLVCIAAIYFSSCVLQFPCFLGSFYYIWPWVFFASSSDYLGSLKLEGSFSQSFPIGTASLLCAVWDIDLFV